MGARESCGLIVFGRREGNYAAYGLTDPEGKFLTKLYCKNLKSLKYQQVCYADLLRMLSEAIETDEEILDTQMSTKLFLSWKEELKPYLVRNSQLDHQSQTKTPPQMFDVKLDDFYLLWHNSIKAYESRDADSTGCCGGRMKHRQLSEQLIGQTFTPRAPEGSERLKAYKSITKGSHESLDNNKNDK
ncbi:UNKNOWN [Stylonychia lemnae]|uniref:Uncharacterized protein n=1 Tax=Stylonychia lemnae TaxID=5949 RepID=A0A078B7N2_STYLE|nr:UNKNOWN [Stylonychia lemnae]|eukprot:CDW90236.1 UNKNOWN [Stylonychia lemnae]